MKRATVAGTLRHARQRLGLSLRDIEEAAGVSHVFLLELELGRSALPPARARRIAAAFDVDARMLISLAMTEAMEEAKRRVLERWAGA